MSTWGDVWRQLDAGVAATEAMAEELKKLGWRLRKTHGIYCARRRKRVRKQKVEVWASSRQELLARVRERELELLQPTPAAVGGRALE